jgi:hypothetical protein
VEASRRSGVLPLRPLTLGELLDAAVALLRGHAVLFLGTAALLAAAEQALLYPLRQAAGLRAPFYLPSFDRFGEYWLVLGVGLATEATIIALLGGLTAGAAVPAMLGDRVSGRDLVRGARFPAVIVVALVAGVVAGGFALAGLLLWIFGYGLLGLAAPAVVVDRLGPGSALVRSLTLASRSAMRACWIRVTGYFGWLMIRLALATGGVALVSRLLHLRPGAWTTTIFAIAVWIGVNAVAYPTLACLDAVLHLETRMRTEGLDIALARAQHRREPAGPILAVPR